MSDALPTLWLTRGASYTFPILSIDGQRIDDSTAIIAALEERYPEPPLYPADPAERRRALELEELFDEELGPAIRLFAWHELGKDRERFEALMKSTAPGALAKLPPGPTTAYARAFTALRFRAGDAAASLFYPLARPEEGPLPADQDGAAGFEAFRQPLLERRGVQWVKEMFRRHRKPALAATAAAAQS